MKALRSLAWGCLVAAFVGPLPGVRGDAPTSLRPWIAGDRPTELAPHRGGNVYAPCVVVNGSQWHLWYGGQGRDGHDRIHHAESTDGGTTWRKRGVVVDAGSANHVNDPSVVRAMGRWWMFYTVAERGTEDAIALAVSTDGERWEKRGVVLAPGPSGSWDSRLVGRPSVLWEDGRFRMWYDGQPRPEDRDGARLEGARAVGLATSTDGIAWTRGGDRPVFLGGAGAVDVSRSGSGYRMLYEGREGTWAAWSMDGRTWEARGLLLPRSGGDIDRHGHVTPHWVAGRDGDWICLGAAGRDTWDGNAIVAVPASAVPALGRVLGARP